MPRFEFHPGAREALGRRAARLLEHFEDFHPSEPGLDKAPLHPDTVIAATIEESQVIGPVDLEIPDPKTGKATLIVIDTGSRPKALRGENCTELEDLIAEISKPTAVSSRASRNFLRSVIKSWLRDQLSGKTSGELATFIEEALEKAARELTIWIPISNLHIQSSFQLGQVVFQTLSRQKIDEWLERFKASTPAETIWS